MGEEVRWRWRWRWWWWWQWQPVTPRQREVVEVGVEQAEARDHERARRGAARQDDVGGGVVSHEEEEERLVAVRRMVEPVEVVVVEKAEAVALAGTRRALTA